MDGEEEPSWMSCDDDDLLPDGEQSPAPAAAAEAEDHAANNAEQGGASESEVSE